MPAYKRRLDSLFEEHSAYYIDSIYGEEIDEHHLAAQLAQGISNLPVVTSDGMILPASSLAEVQLTAGPTEIRHTP